MEDQLNQFRSQIKRTPPLISKKSPRFSTIDNDSTDDESDTVEEKTYPIFNNKSTKRSFNHVRSKPLGKNSHLIRHQSLKCQNRPLLFEKRPPRTDSTSMPRSEISSDLQSSRPDNLSSSALSNLGSEYDNMGENDTTSKQTIQSHSLVRTDESDDETTLAATIDRCYF